MRLFPGLLAAFLLTGCNNSPPTVPPTSPSQPATYVVSGSVAEMVDGVARPVPEHFVALFVQSPGALHQYLTTDQNGHYTVQVPKSRVFASAVWGKRQPCIASALVDRDTTIDVQVFMGSSVAPPGATGPMITGFVYETTPDGRKPLRGAAAWLDLGVETYVASTETDTSGRFYFCRVNTSVQMFVDAAGYEFWSQTISGTRDTSLEIELRKR